MKKLSDYYELDKKLITILFVFMPGLFGCFSAGQKESEKGHLPNQNFIKVTGASSLRSEIKGHDDYSGHYLNPEVSKLIGGSDLHGQSIILIYSLIRLDASNFDGEIAYEFKQLFEKPYGFERVASEAVRLCNMQLMHGTAYSVGELLGAMDWLKRNQ